jgi:hypothetical protein
MITVRQARGNDARRIAIAIVVAGLLGVAGPARADTTHADGSKTLHLETPNGGLEYPNPQYPNRKPLRGNYPGSYTSTVSTPAQPPSNRFDWLAAGVGAAGMLGLILLFAAGRSATHIARNRRHGIPFVIDVRDDTPTTG